MANGRVTFLDFGLVKHFTDTEIATFVAMVRAAAYDHDATAFRRVLERAGMLRPGAPATDDEVGEYFSQFYEAVRFDQPVTWSSEYSSRIVRHTFDRSSPIAQYATVPRAFVFIQRINLGLYALLGELRRHRQLPADRRGAVAVRRRPAEHSHGRRRAALAPRLMVGCADLSGGLAGARRRRVRPGTSLSGGRSGSEGSPASAQWRQRAGFGEAAVAVAGDAHGLLAHPVDQLESAVGADRGRVDGDVGRVRGAAQRLARTGGQHAQAIDAGRVEELPSTTGQTDAAHRAPRPERRPSAPGGVSSPTRTTTWRSGR